MRRPDVFDAVRLAGLPFLLVLVLTHRGDFPPGHELSAWLALAVLAAGTFVLLVVRRHRASGGWAVALDFAVASVLVVTFAYEPGQPLRAVFFLVIVEAALRLGMRWGFAIAVLSPVVLSAAEIFREGRFDFSFQLESILIRLGIGLAMALVIGRLVEDIAREVGRSEARTSEAERLRDELGRRVDVLEASNRCARALASSLRLDEAFEAFIDELRGLIPFERAAILLVEEGGARVMATAGTAADSFLPPGTTIDIAGSVLERVVEGQSVYRKDLEDGLYPEERELVSLGLRSRVVAPLQLGPRTVGALALSRGEPSAFTTEEVALATLLGRLVATAVQNIRTYEAERTTVDELRRLSTLRADFVSLVSHELRSPMAAVIGSARTLQSRWRELRPEQREAFLAVIGDETSRLAALIGDVLDTSRIDAGTFGYTFTDVDLADVVREATAAAELGQDEVRLNVEIPTALPPVRGDRDRLRQLVDNLISNALKYSESGSAVDVAASERNGSVLVRVRDRGPGIAREDQGLIFEKFGRADVSNARPGTGLGLFISRSFAEAHGGTLHVESAPGAGATFTLALPFDASARRGRGSP